MENRGCDLQERHTAGCACHSPQTMRERNEPIDCRLTRGPRLELLVLMVRRNVAISSSKSTRRNLPNPSGPRRW